MNKILIAGILIVVIVIVYIYRKKSTPVTNSTQAGIDGIVFPNNSWNYKAGVALDGGSGMLSMNTKTWQECQTLCENTPNCSGFWQVPIGSAGNCYWQAGTPIFGPSMMNAVAAIKK